MPWDEDKAAGKAAAAGAGRVEWAAPQLLGQVAIASAQTAKNASSTQQACPAISKSVRNAIRRWYAKGNAVIVVIASGKGGTGKTTVAVNLALSQQHARPLLLDCDVEEPNAALFVQPEITARQRVGQMIPQIDLERCTFCGRCAEVCQYNAIAVVGEKVLVFPEMCHGCGSCTLNCPTEAIHEVFHDMGMVEQGRAGDLDFAQGTMNVGEAMAVPVIRHLKHSAIPSDRDARPIILDAPPGTACPVVETLRGADIALMVTEPTPFGLHDLRLAVEVARDELGLSVAVVINRDGIGDRGVEDYCAAEHIPILMRIPLERAIAEAYSEGISLIQIQPAYGERFAQLWADLEQLVHDRKTGQDRAHERQR
jgi:MinD superfamily P-loop ATPase